MIAWLWTQSALHHSWSLRFFEQDVLESIELQQFVLVMRHNRPAAYLSWACLSAESEIQYMVDPHSLKREDKRSGAHLWLLNWIAPHGGTDIAKWVVRDCLFHSSVGHMLRVKPGDHQQGRIVSARGARVSEEDYALEISRMLKSFQEAVARRKYASDQLRQ